jgi:carotenoid cleavage dioxygenase
MKTGAARLQEIGPQRMEFPQINRSMTGRPYRYGYSLGVGMVGTGTNRHETIDSILKHDVLSGEVQSFKVSEGVVPGEPFFVPSTDAGNEDDGYVLSYVYSAQSHTSSLWIMDAHNLQNVIAKIELGVRVPQGFHGLWLPMEQLA